MKNKKQYHIAVYENSKKLFESLKAGMDKKTSSDEMLEILIENYKRSKK